MSIQRDSRKIMQSFWTKVKEIGVLTFEVVFLSYADRSRNRLLRFAQDGKRGMTQLMPAEM